MIEISDIEELVLRIFFKIFKDKNLYEQNGIVQKLNQILKESCTSDDIY